MLEALLFAAAVTTAAANLQAKPPAAPSAELLEFIADWTELEARQILDAQHAKAPLPSLGQATASNNKQESRREH
ncbi:MAG: hypothetical protein V4607_11815 [Pseudomonadota bacterium]